MATDRLGVYNVALAAIGERSLDSLSEDGEPRRELDSVWSRGNGALRFFLEQGRWMFAMRTQQLDPSATTEPEFGFEHAFELPDDFVHLDMLSADERFSLPLGAYEIEAQSVLYADVDPVYIRFISDDEDYGGDYSKWPETFTLWAGHWMATQIAARLSAQTNLERLEQRTRKLLVDARSKNAVQAPTRYPPAGTWASARLYGGRSVERGKRSRLIG